MPDVPDKPDKLKRQFSTHWQSSTADSNLTLHGFRRFKTTHLLNLRFLEAEIAELDHAIYQAGLSLDIPPSTTDRLGLKHSKRDKDVPEFDDAAIKQLVLRLRGLLQQYDEALISFNKIMSMDTFSLLDDEQSSSQRDDLTLYEKYKTRLLRVDQGPRVHLDPFQRWLHKLLRKFRYWRLSNKPKVDAEGPVSRNNKRKQWSYQSTSLISSFLSRLVIALTTSVFLIVPLALLSSESRKGVQLTIIAVCIVVFSFVVTVLLKASNLEMMIVTAAYAAILSVFVSNAPEGVK
ncbi:hypothetical protein GGR54DRAFT_606722 [Hypoxylon sp. NC1633]|nr:hypothetical protein GGR54DRAFT_606722 [Hypoxylon sp. NC1633]